MKLEPPFCAAPPPQIGLNEKRASVYGKMLDPSHGLFILGDSCTPAAVLVSTNRANSYEYAIKFVASSGCSRSS